MSNSYNVFKVDRCLGGGLRPKKGKLFLPGNKASTKENLSPHSHSLKMKALLRGWETKQRIRNGEKVMTAKAKEKIKHRKRIRLKETIAKEAREIQEIARQNAMAAMERLQQIIEDPESQDSSAIAAAAIVLDRAYGKASQTNINATINPDGKPNEVTARQLDERIKQALKRVEDLTNRAPEPPASEERPKDFRKLN